MRDSRKDAGRFSTTEWSVVLAAGDSQAPDRREALASLCRTYWYPIYAHVRQLGGPVDRAQDLTQGFFAYLLQHRALSVATPDKGRFRSFLSGGGSTLPGRAGAHAWEVGHGAPGEARHGAPVRDEDGRAGPSARGSSAGGRVRGAVYCGFPRVILAHVFVAVEQSRLTYSPITGR